MAREDVGTCGSCNQTFAYRLIHNGFNGTAFAYFDHCGSTALLDEWYKGVPRSAKLKVHGPVNPEAEALLKPCPCGGRFLASASPRCPHCSAELLAEEARSYIEANAPGTQAGWRWQGSWDGTYCIIVEDQLFQDNWAG